MGRRLSTKEEERLRLKGSSLLDQKTTGTVLGSLIKGKKLTEKKLAEKVSSHDLSTMIETATYRVSPTLTPQISTAKNKTVTIRPSSLKTASSNNNKSQQIIVIPQNMLVNGCISVNGLKKIIDNNEATIKSAEQRGNLKRPASSSSIAAEDSTYGSDSEGSEHTVDGKPVRKRANLDHLSPEEKLMRRKLKNRVAAQNARDKKRTKMEEMEAELLRLKNHAKSLEGKNAELVSENQRLVAENDDLRSSCESRIHGQESSSPLVAGQTPESAVLTNVPQQQEQVCPRSAGGPLGSTASLIMASKLLLNVLKTNTRQKKLPLKKRWPT